MGALWWFLGANSCGFIVAVPNLHYSRGVGGPVTDVDAGVEHQAGGADHGVGRSIDAVTEVPATGGGREESIGGAGDPEATLHGVQGRGRCPGKHQQGEAKEAQPSHHCLPNT